MQERRTDLATRERFEAVRRSLVDRLRRVCGGWPQRELDQLTARMTRLQFKYEGWTGMPVRGSSSSDPVGA